MRKLMLVAAALLATVSFTAAPTGANATSRWAPESTAKIHPGVQMYTAGAQCTANFVYTDAKGRVYVGYAAHCAGLGDNTDTNGCETKSLPLGTPVTFVEGGNLFSDGTVVGHGRLAYSSWLRMQQLGTKSAARCAYNDLALVRVVRADRGKVNPTVPVFGGPTALRTTVMPNGAAVYSYGNSSLRGGFGLFNDKSGSVLDRLAGGMAYDVETANQGVPGDSGSGFLDASGRAVGVLSTISFGVGLPPVSNEIGSLYAELTWAQKHSGIAGLHLVKGTRAFSAS